MLKCPSQLTHMSLDQITIFATLKCYWLCCFSFMHMDTDPEGTHHGTSHATGNAKAHDCNIHTCRKSPSSLLSCSLSTSTFTSNSEDYWLSAMEPHSPLPTILASTMSKKQAHQSCQHHYGGISKSTRQNNWRTNIQNHQRTPRHMEGNATSIVHSDVAMTASSEHCSQWWPNTDNNLLDSLPFKMASAPLILLPLLLKASPWRLYCWLSHWWDLDWHIFWLCWCWGWLMQMIVSCAMDSIQWRGMQHRWLLRKRWLGAWIIGPMVLATTTQLMLTTNILISRLHLLVVQLLCHVSRLICFERLLLCPLDLAVRVLVQTSARQTSGDAHIPDQEWKVTRIGWHWLAFGSA